MIIICSYITLSMLNTDISHFENSVDPDQLASQKPADLEPHCFSLYTYKYIHVLSNIKLESFEFIG